MSGTNPNNCSLIYFYGAFGIQDVINGPLHTNDRLRVCGTPQFKGPASTSYPGYQPAATTVVKPGDQLWQGRSGCTNACRSSWRTRRRRTWSTPTRSRPLPSNSAVKTYTNGVAPKNGCLYKGPTSIVFNAAGTMTVWSPTTPTASTGCPLGNGSTAASAQTGALPPNGVIYVDTATNTSSNDPGDCFTSGGSLRSGNRLGYPVNPSGTSNDDVTQYNCLSGDVFVRGALNGQVTIGAANDIVVTDDLTYHDKPAGATSYQGNDILGLIANRFVSVYHPVNSGGTDLTGSLADPEINAAILSVQHSFWTQNYNKGNHNNLGTLTVFGAIASSTAARSARSTPAPATRSPATSRTTTTTTASSTSSRRTS